VFFEERSRSAGLKMSFYFSVITLRLRRQRTAAPLGEEINL